MDSGGPNCFWLGTISIGLRTIRESSDIQPAIRLPLAVISLVTLLDPLTIHSCTSIHTYVQYISSKYLPSPENPFQLLQYLTGKPVQALLWCIVGCMWVTMTGETQKQTIITICSADMFCILYVCMLCRYYCCLYHHWCYYYWYLLFFIYVPFLHFKLHVPPQISAICKQN